MPRNVAVAWVAGLVLAPGGLSARAVRRSRPLEHRALKPERDKLIVSGPAGWLRLDQAESLTDREGLTQALCALYPRQRSDVIAGELEQIKRNEMKLADCRGVGLERRSTYRREVLDGSAVKGAQRDQLSIEDRPARSLGERLQQRAEAIAQARTPARPGADASVLVDRDQQPEPVHFGSIAQSPRADHVTARTLSIGSGIGIARAKN
jgi:hypothetical protein